MSDEAFDTEAAKKASAVRTRRSFLVAAAGAAGGYGVYRYIDRAPGIELLSKPLRKALNFNEAVSRGVFDERALAPTYDVRESVDLRINGNYGLKQDMMLDSYRLQVVGVDGPRRYPHYVDDVTTWNYQYANANAKYEGHDTKVAPKAEGVKRVTGGGNADIARGMSEGASLGGDAVSRKQSAAARPDGGAGALGPSSRPEEGPGPKIAPEFEKALAEERAAEMGKVQRGQEEAGESDSTLDPGTPGLLLTMADVTKLPRHELVTQFKCIEGWSEIVHWAGLRLADFIEAYPPEKNAQGQAPKYIYMETPNGDYYCGFELRECQHPQSLLVTEMAGKPLTQAHGAPVRLHMPIKYGYKQIKRIGLIAYTDVRPDDYWTKLGYDWYAGL